MDVELLKIPACFVLNVQKPAVMVPEWQAVPPVAFSFLPG